MQLLYIMALSVFVSILILDGHVSFKIFVLIKTIIILNAYPREFNCRKDWKRMFIAVDERLSLTGGSEKAGTHVAKHLLAKGHRVLLWPGESRPGWVRLSSFVLNQFWRTFKLSIWSF